MRDFLARRLIQSLVLLFIVLTITFFLLRLAPGDPMSRYDNPDFSPETVRGIRESLGLDKPLAEQYVRWSGSFARGDFGVSLRYRRPVRDLLAEAIPNTLRLTVEDITGSPVTLFSGPMSEFDSANLGNIAPASVRSYRVTVAFPNGHMDSGLQGAVTTLILEITGVSS